MGALCAFSRHCPRHFLAENMTSASWGLEAKCTVFCAVMPVLQEIVKWKGGLYYVDDEPEQEPQILPGSMVAFSKNGCFQGEAYRYTLETMFSTECFSLNSGGMAHNCNNRCDCVICSCGFPRNLVETCRLQHFKKIDCHVVRCAEHADCCVHR